LYGDPAGWLLLLVLAGLFSPLLEVLLEGKTATLPAVAAAGVRWSVQEARLGGRGRDEGGKEEGGEGVEGLREGGRDEG